MKRLILPLIAAFALPASVNAESVWLILRYGAASGAGYSAALEKIEMRDETHCEENGTKWMGTKFTDTELGKKTKYINFGYVCMTGK